MAVIVRFLSTLLFAILSHHVVQALEYATPAILVSRANAATNETQKYCMFYYPTVTKLVPDEDSVQYYQVADALEWNVCDVSEPPPATVDLQDRLVFIADNNCSDISQAGRVESYGAAGALMVRNHPKNIPLNQTEYNLTLAFILNTSYIEIMDSGDEVTVGMYSPLFTIFNPSFFIIWLISLFIIVVASIWSGKVRHKLYLNERETIVREPGEGEQENVRGVQQEEIFMRLSPLKILGCIVILSLMLLSLYFFLQYMVYVIIAMFCLFSVTSLFTCFHPLVSRIPCGTCRTPYFNIFLVRGTLELRQILLLLFSLAVPIVWVVMRNESWAWILQDFMGIALCIFILRTSRFPNLKILTIFMVGLVVYDVFFVFITPLFTKDGKSIMVDVAMGGSTNEQMPVVFMVPNLHIVEITQVCANLKDYSLLGFGDVLVPGFLVSYAFFFDLLVGTPRYVYFVVTVIGYGLGLVIAFVASLLMGVGQPALLYLVPLSLIPIMVTALIRREFKAIWSGDTDKQHHKF